MWVLITICRLLSSTYPTCKLCTGSLRGQDLQQLVAILCNLGRCGPLHPRVGKWPAPFYEEKGTLFSRSVSQAHNLLNFNKDFHFHSPPSLNISQMWWLCKWFNNLESLRTYCMKDWKTCLGFCLTLGFPEAVTETGIQVQVYLGDGSRKHWWRVKWGRKVKEPKWAGHHTAYHPEQWEFFPWGGPLGARITPSTFTSGWRS